MTAPAPAPDPPPAEPAKGFNAYEPLKCGCGAPLHVVCSKDPAHPHADFETPSQRKARLAKHLTKPRPGPTSAPKPKREPRTSTVVYKGPGICTYLDCSDAVEPKPPGARGRPRSRCPKHSTFAKYGR